MKNHTTQISVIPGPNQALHQIQPASRWLGFSRSQTPAWERTQFGVLRASQAPKGDLGCQDLGSGEPRSPGSQVHPNYGKLDMVCTVGAVREPPLLSPQSCLFAILPQLFRFIRGFKISIGPLLGENRKFDDETRPGRLIVPDPDMSIMIRHHLVGDGQAKAGP